MRKIGLFLVFLGVLCGVQNAENEDGISKKNSQILQTKNAQNSQNSVNSLQNSAQNSTQNSQTQNAQTSIKNSQISQKNSQTKTKNSAQNSQNQAQKTDTKNTKKTSKNSKKNSQTQNKKAKKNSQRQNKKGTQGYKAQEVDFYSHSITQKDNFVETNSSVLLFSNDYFISANRAEYNETSSEIALFGDVNVLRRDGERFNACEARVNLNNDEADFKDFFYADTSLEMWFKSEQSSLNTDEFFATKAIVSSCNVEKPDWEIRFSEGSFDRDEKRLHLWHPRFYVKGVPAFYLPFLTFGIDSSRKSGLLMPDMEFNQDDVFFYRQPIFIAPYESWDIELRPQLRTARGLGLYTRFRFMDSPLSYGDLRGGFFREYNSYFEKEGLKNKIHRGIELRYLRQSALKSLFGFGDNIQEGIWIDGVYLNDVDYLNLETRDFRDLTSLVESKFSYFLANEKHYGAIYATYYIDTAKLDNKTTLQELPSVQYHNFLSPIFYDFLRYPLLQYSFDATFSNYYRKVGTYANVLNLNLPFNFHIGFLGDYLHIKFTEKLYASFVNYQRAANDRERIFKNDHEFELYTELSRPYKHFYHTLYFGASYLLKGASSDVLDEYICDLSGNADNLTNGICNLNGKTGYNERNYISIYDEPQSFSLKFVQFFYNSKGQKKLKHRLNAIYDLENETFDEFRNLLEYYFTPNFSVSNETTYSNSQQKFTKSLSNLSFSAKRLIFNVSHAYKYDPKEALSQGSSTNKYSFIIANLNYTHNINHNFFGSIRFDIARLHTNTDIDSRFGTSGRLNFWEVGYTFQRKCWNYSITYRERIDPQLTSAGINAKFKNGVYFTFNLYPLGGVSYDFSLRQSEQSVGSSATGGGIY